MEWLEVTAICVALISPVAGGIGIMAVVALSLLDKSEPENKITDTKTK